MAEQTINSISGLSCDSHGARSYSVAARVSEEGVEAVDLQEEQVGGCKSRCQANPRNRISIAVMYLMRKKNQKNKNQETKEDLKM